MSDIIPDTVGQVAKVSVGTVGVIVIGAIFGAYLWLQLELQRDMIKLQDEDRNRVYAVMQGERERTASQVERFIAAMDQQARALTAIAIANESASDILSQIKQDQRAGTAQLIETVTQENRAVLQSIQETIKAE